MTSIPIENGEVSLLRSMVPIGTECYLVFRNGVRYLNVRTDDETLLARLDDAARLQRT